MNQNQQPRRQQPRRQQPRRQNTNTNILNQRSLTNIFRQMPWPNPPNVFIQRLVENINNNRYNNIGDVVNNGNTPLMIAIEYSLPNLALAILQTGQAAPNHTNNNNSTALIEAIQKGYTELALAIIRTGQSRPTQVDNHGFSAYFYAHQHDEDEVKEELEHYLSPQIANTLERIQNVYINFDGTNEERNAELNHLFQELAENEQRFHNGIDRSIFNQQMNDLLNTNSNDDFVVHDNLTDYPDSERGIAVVSLYEKVQELRNNILIHHEASLTQPELNSIRGMRQYIDQVTGIVEHLSSYDMDDDDRFDIYDQENLDILIDIWTRLKDYYNVLNTITNALANPRANNNDNNDDDNDDDNDDSLYIYNNLSDYSNKSGAFVELYDRVNNTLNHILNTNEQNLDANQRNNITRIQGDINNLQELVNHIRSMDNHTRNQYNAQDALPTLNEHWNVLKNDFNVLIFIEHSLANAPVAQPQQPVEQPLVTGSINVNDLGFDSEDQEEKTVKQYLSENSHHIALMLNGKIYLINKTRLREQIRDDANNKYACKRAGNNSSFVLDSNIYFNPVYFSLSAIIGAQILVDLNNIIGILGTQSRTFIATNTNRTAKAIMSLAFYNGATGVGADHCQTGKETPIYRIEPIGTIDVASTTNAPVAQNTATNDAQEIKVQYKGEVFKFYINLNTTLDNIRQMLLDKLNINSNTNPTVRFIYKGRLYNRDSFGSKLTTLENPPFGITLQAQIIQPTGGKKLTKRGNKKHINKLTKHYKKHINKKITKRHKKNNNKLTKYHKKQTKKHLKKLK